MSLVHDGDTTAKSSIGLMHRNLLDPEAFREGVDVISCDVVERDFVVCLFGTYCVSPPRMYLSIIVVPWGLTQR